MTKKITQSKKQFCSLEITRRDQWYVVCIATKCVQSGANGCHPDVRLPGLIIRKAEPEGITLVDEETGFVEVFHLCQIISDKDTRERFRGILALHGCGLSISVLSTEDIAQEARDIKEAEAASV